MSLPPIVKVRDVPVPVERAFEHFTAGFGTWWPLKTHAISEDVVEAHMELRVGGRVYEIRTDGSEASWGEVVAYDPHSHVAFTFVPWHTGTPESTVEVRFEAIEGGTRVRLEHRDWDRLEELQPGIRASYDTGWDVVFGECYVGALGGIAA